MRAGPLPTPSEPALWLGFPSADGTPVAQAPFWAFIRERPGHREITLFDQVSRTLLRPTSLVPFGELATGAKGAGPLLLVSLPLEIVDNLRLVDLLTGAYDTLPEIRSAGIEFALSGQGRFIAYTSTAPEGRHVQLFDRRQRLVDRLTRLNAGRETFDSNIDATGRWLAYVTFRGGQQVIELYDTIAGVVDPLPALAVLGDLTQPNISDDARWLAFIILTAPDRGDVAIYDRLTGAIDRLPELNREGPARNVAISGDGLILQANIRNGGHWRVFRYLRPSGFVDRQPEVNDPDWDVTF
jgi:hypothetical protein